ncbi:MAG: hypothetical protein ACP5NK_07590 [Thermoplasmata archaeon]
MKPRLLLLGVVFIIAVLLGSAFAYFYTEYYSPPFDGNWKVDPGNMDFSSNMGEISINDTFFWIDFNGWSQKGNVYNGNQSFSLNALALNNGSYLWRENFTLSVFPGSFPHIYNYNGNVGLVVSAFDINLSGYVVNSNASALYFILINARNGSIIFRSKLIPHNAYSIPMLSPLSIVADNVVLAGTSPLGEFPNAFWTMYEINLTEWDVHKNTTWNQSIEWKVAANFSGNQLVYTDFSPHVTVLILDGLLNPAQSYHNSEIFVFNTTNGKTIANIVVNGTLSMPRLYDKTLLCLDSFEGRYAMRSINIDTGNDTTMFAIFTDKVYYAGNDVIFRNAENISAYTVTGSLEWEAGIPMSQYPDDYMILTPILPGYVLISLIGDHSLYTIFNLSSGQVTWRVHYDSSFLFGTQNKLYTPLFFLNNRLIYTMTENNQVSLLSDNVTNLL